MNQTIKNKILQKSISLKTHRIKDLAWRKEDALTLINSIMKDKVGILGGNICKLTPSHLEHYKESNEFLDTLSSHAFIGLAFFKERRS